GKYFGDSSDKVQVKFRVGGRDQKDAAGKVTVVGGLDVAVDAQVLSDTQLQVTVPNTVALGTAHLTVVRDVHGSGKDVRESNTAEFPLTSGYAFAAQRFGHVAVFDTRPKVPDPDHSDQTIANPNFNKLVAEIPISGGLPSYVAPTPDNTRAYVTTIKSGI